MEAIQKMKSGNVTGSPEVKSGDDNCDLRVGK